MSFEKTNSKPTTLDGSAAADTGEMGGVGRMSSSVEMPPSSNRFMASRAFSGSKALRKPSSSARALSSAYSWYLRWLVNDVGVWGELMGQDELRENITHIPSVNFAVAAYHNSCAVLKI